MMNDEDHRVEIFIIRHSSFRFLAEPDELLYNLAAS
jgi:hypothetical protein